MCTQLLIVHRLWSCIFNFIFTSYLVLGAAGDIGFGDAAAQRRARLLACHSPTREVARQTLTTLLADLRSLMRLSHKLVPQVVISDQGSQFMSHHFRDFLSEEQVRHWPSVAYTPQQNAVVERMWGTRFATARVSMKFANLGPAFHP